MLKLKGIEKIFKIENGNLYSVDVENVKFYHNLVGALINEDVEQIVFSKDYVPINFSKEILIVIDPFSLNPNNKKILNALYKKIQQKYLNSQIEKDISLVNETLVQVLNNLSLELNMEIDFDPEISLTDILSLYKFSFKENNSDYLAKFITYLKANLEIADYSTIISLNLLPLLTENEIKLLKEELEMLNLCLININMVCYRHKNLVDTTIVDIDLCEI